MSAPTGEPLSLRPLLEEMIARDASDLHLAVGNSPRLRVDGHIVASAQGQALGPRDTLQLAYSVLTDAQKKRFELEDELDFSFGIANLSRFRGNVFRQRGCVSMVLRQIPFTVRTFEDLHLPPVVATFADRPRGLVLVTGPTGSGKSTTLAALIDKINRERDGHIITVEDPIEFIHTHRHCIINQREVGADTRSFASALTHALREDPDVILIGEMRDLETVSAALTIADTGHLVFATLHANSAAEAINRVLDVFPGNHQAQVRAQLASVLEGVVTQALIPRASGRGRALVAEVLVATPAIRTLIREEKVHQVVSMMQSGKKYGMQTMNDALFALYSARQVTLEECLRVTPDVADFQRMVGRAPLDEPPPPAAVRARPLAGAARH